MPRPRWWAHALAAQKHFHFLDAYLEDLVPRTILFMFLSVDFVVNFMSGDLLATLEQELGSIAALFTSCVILKILMKILTNMP